MKVPTTFTRSFWGVLKQVYRRLAEPKIEYLQCYNAVSTLLLSSVAGALILA
jgi:hypothetical protein